MARLEQVSLEDLRAYLTDVEGNRPTLRLVVGINYKEGVSQSDIADWYAISRTTVHNWLNRLERLEDEPVEEVIHDADRPGRPAKLTPQQWEALGAILEKSPEEVGVDLPHWTPSLVQILVRERFDVEYSRRHIRELLNRAGISWDSARRSTPDSENQLPETLRKWVNGADSSG